MPLYGNFASVPYDVWCAKSAESACVGEASRNTAALSWYLLLCQFQERISSISSSLSILIFRHTMREPESGFRTGCLCVSVVMSIGQ